MPDSRPSHAAGGGERTGSRVVDLRAGVSAETLATREQYLSVAEQRGGGVIGDHPSGKAKGSADRVVQLGWVLPGEQDLAVGQESSRGAKVAQPGAYIGAGS